MKYTTFNPLNKFSKRVWSFRHAYRGIRNSILTQTNLRVHLIVTILVAILGFFLKIDYFEWIAVVITCVMVIAAELINTAVEELTDLISPDYHKKAGYAKDASAGAVLILAIASALVGSLIFVPKLMDLFGIYF
jgi:diacylglycerol kinase